MQKKLKFLVFALMTAAWCTVAMSGAYGQILGVPVTPQQQNQWCWAGSSDGILRYYGTVVEQCTMADFARINNGWGSDDCCLNPTGAICNQPNYLYGTSGSLQAIMANWGVSSIAYAYALSQTTVQTVIAQTRPFVIRWGWDGGGGHFLVGRGYESGIVHYMDPWPGNGYASATYSWVVNGSNHEWTHSLKVTTTLCYCGIKGDVNNDASTDPLDVSYLVNKVFLSQDALHDYSATCDYPNGDVNCDASTDPLDVSYLVNKVFLSQDALCDRCP